MGVFSGTSTFTGLLERATSQLQLEPDWASILQICDCIRQQDVSPKFAVAALKKKMFDRNPHVSRYALTVLEACMKNCGAVMHDEIATKDFMEELRNLIKNSSDPVKEKALGLIQTWSHAFRNEPKYKIVQDTYNLMKMEGCKFPVFNESDAMFSADSAPTWAEGDVCHMCRVKFGTFIRQHHCRSCGQVFCKKCSSKESIIPQYGIEKEVRVCDPCFFKLNPQSKAAPSDKPDTPATAARAAGSESNDLPAEYLNSPLFKESQEPPKKDARELKDQEEEELQLAMALSLSQEEAQKDTQKRPSLKSSLYSSDESYAVNPKPASRIYAAAASEIDDDTRHMDPDLARYLNRSYWEDRKEQVAAGRTSPSAPAAQMNSSVASPYSSHTENKIATKGKKKKKKAISYAKYNNPQASQVPVSNDQGLPADEEMDESSETLVGNFRQSVEMLADRMQDISGQGKHIAMDATVQSLFQTVSAMHPQLLRLIEQQEQETANNEGVQEKLGLVKDARATLEEAREQHREKLRQQELEQDMLRRMQIEQKLELMRQQKAEYLAYQQRIQTERQIALEQQHQQMRYQQMQPPYPGQYPALPADSIPYSSMGYVPPPAGMQPPTAGAAAPPSMVPATAPAAVTTAQPPYNQPMSLPQGYAPQGYQPEALPGQYQAPPQYQPPKTEGYPSQQFPPGYGVEVSDGPPSMTMLPPTQQPATEYQPQSLLDEPSNVYSPQPSAAQPPQGYTSPHSSAPAMSQAPPPQYNQATGQPPQQQMPAQYGGHPPPHPHSNTQSPPPPQHAPTPPQQGQFSNQPPPPMAPHQYQPSQPQGLPPDNSGYYLPPSQGQLPGQQGLPPPAQQGPPPPGQGLPPGQGYAQGHPQSIPQGPGQMMPPGQGQFVQPTQGQLPPQQVQGQLPPQQAQGQLPPQQAQGQLPPQQVQGQLPPQQGGYAPQQPQPQQGYEPQPQQQYHNGPPPQGQQYGAPPQQPSGPPHPQRQLSEQQLISFD